MSELLSLIRAGAKPVIGMVQLDPLPGSSRYVGGHIGAIVDAALQEAKILADHGVEMLMVQNLGDLPVASRATPAQVAWLTRVATDIRMSFGRPVGLNLLENDAEAMFAAASAAGADFVRIKVYVGAMMTPFGIERGEAFAAIRARNACDANDIAIFADVHDRTGVPLASGGFAEDVRVRDPTRRRGWTGSHWQELPEDARTRRGCAKACRPRPDPYRGRRHSPEFRRGGARRRRRHRQLITQGFE